VRVKDKSGLSTAFLLSLKPAPFRNTITGRVQLARNPPYGIVVYLCWKA
jgi:hypothetical protein